MASDMTARKGGRQWRKLRARAFAETPLCKHCLERNRVRAGTVADHILALVNGGAEFDLANVQVLCDECHAAKTAKDIGCTPKVRIGLDGFPIKE